jgi:integrase
MGETTLNAALRRMGYDKSEITAHGFRTMASTRLNEMGFNADTIERQLAHVDGNGVRRAYNAAQYWDERITMMQRWADCLDGLRAT